MNYFTLLFLRRAGLPFSAHFAEPHPRFVATVPAPRSAPDRLAPAAASTAPQPVEPTSALSTLRPAA